MKTQGKQYARYIQLTNNNLIYWHQLITQHKEDDFSYLLRVRQNLFQAISVGLTIPATLTETVTLMLATFDLVERYGFWQEWIPLMQTALAQLPPDAAHCRISLQIQLGRLYRAARQFDQALIIDQATLHLTATNKSSPAYAKTVLNLASNYCEKRQYLIAKSYAQEAFECFSQLPDMHWYKAATQTTLGLIALGQEDHNAAEKHLLAATATWREINALVPLARTLNNLANTYKLARNYEAALACLAEAEELLALQNSPNELLQVQLSLGVLYFTIAQLPQAEKLFRRVYAYTINMPAFLYYRAYASLNLGNVFLERNQLTEAEHYTRLSIRLWREIGDRFLMGTGLGNLGEILAQRGKAKLAAKTYQKAIDCLKQVPNEGRALSKITRYQRQLERLKKEWDVQ